jgi:hypothetical protein
MCNPNERHRQSEAGRAQRPVMSSGTFCLINLTPRFRMVTLDSAMARHFPSTWLPSCGAIVPLLAIVCPPNLASASCGDYVVVGGGHAKDHITSPAAPVPAPAKPCQGPLCQSHNDVPPLAPPPASAPVTGADLFCCLAPIQISGSKQICWMTLFDIQFLGDFAIDIFHPPKPATV